MKGMDGLDSAHLRATINAWMEQDEQILRKGGPVELHIDELLKPRKYEWRRSYPKDLTRGGLDHLRRLHRPD